MKRKDSKGRVLKPNEIQRPDGRYEYRYKSITGERKSIYSWRLTETDTQPANKKHCKSLRELEEDIFKDSYDGIVYRSNMTLNERWDDYINNKTAIKTSTSNNYKYMYNKHVREGLGKMIISNITYSTLKKFYKELLEEKGFLAVSVETFHTMLHPVFDIAVRDGIIRTNPAKDVLDDLKKSDKWIKNKRHSLTREQTRIFLTYVKNTPKFERWYNLMVCLFGTGCRISEMLGLCWSDIYWNDNVISIERNLLYRADSEGKMFFSVTTPKTKNSARKIPMLAGVREALKDERKRQSKTGFCESKVDGVSGFVWTTLNHTSMRACSINETIYAIVRGYNKAEERAATKENREPILLPRFSAHVCRHTFCTRLCEEETDIKMIQEIMGHANVQTTMDIYNESNIDRKKEAFRRLDDIEGII